MWMAFTRQKLFKLLFCLSICWNLGFLIMNHIAETKLNGIKEFTLEYCKHFVAGNAELNQGINCIIPTNPSNVLVDTAEVTNENITSSLKTCPLRGSSLVGPLKVNVKSLHDEAKSVELLSVKKFGAVEFGGWWRPRTCKPRTNVAIMVPVRDREAQLRTFLWHMHPILQRQLLSYRIIVVEQTGNATWNKGIIYNVAFNETLGLGDFDCYIFHDVDLLSENDHNIYDCVSAPKHMSVAVDSLHYRLPHLAIFGGVEVLTKQQFMHVNGFSNLFWGWGGEDDDLYTRITEKGYHLARPHTDISRYKMNKLDHARKDGINKQKIPYLELFGGVEVLTKNQFIHVNGFSNMYWGWGGEDDDLFTRITHEGYPLSRPHKKIGRYKMNKEQHSRKDGLNKENLKMHRDEQSRIKRISTDGLNTIDQLTYTVDVREEKLLTRIVVEVER